MEEKEKRKSGFRLTIGNKILVGFLVLMVLYIINIAIIFFTGRTIDQVVTNSSSIIRPSQDAINDFILMVTRSKMLVTNWVYLQTNAEDKQALRDLQNYEYPALKKNIQELRELWASDSQRWEMDTVFMKFEEMLKIQDEGVMTQLVTFDNYEDPVTKLLAEDVIATQVIPMSAEIIGRLTRIAGRQNTITAESDAELIGSVGRLRNFTFILAAIFIVLALLSAFLLIRAITRPVNFLKNVVVKLGRGELVEDTRTKFSNDEIGEMAGAMDTLVTGLKATTLFAENIGKGNYASDFKPLSSQDVLGNALIDMRNNLAKVAEDDKRRNWATEGLAKFGEILRTNNNDVSKLADEIIGNLVKYLNANQGGIYIVDDEKEGDEETMSMKACYAWDKKKYLNQKIFKGEGLAGQAWQEGDTIYLTDVPDNYVRITSGLGDSNPTCILIVPLKVNDQIFGVVEVASFNEIRDYEVEFVQKIAESIASTISSVKINARTQRLLSESQEMTEQMRAQEEEMRQNMEELQATQEEMQRSQAETESTMLAINTSLAVADFETDGKISKINQNYLSLLGYTPDEIVGEYHRVLLARDGRNSEDYKQFWRELSAGTAKKGVFSLVTKNGESLKVHSNFAPIKNKSGAVIKIMEVAYQINENGESK